MEYPYILYEGNLHVHIKDCIVVSNMELLVVLLHLSGKIHNHTFSFNAITKKILLSVPLLPFEIYLTINVYKGEGCSSLRNILTEPQLQIILWTLHRKLPKSIVNLHVPARPPCWSPTLRVRIFKKIASLCMWGPHLVIRPLRESFGMAASRRTRLILLLPRQDTFNYVLYSVQRFSMATGARSPGGPFPPHGGTNLRLLIILCGNWINIKLTRSQLLPAALQRKIPHCGEQCHRRKWHPSNVSFCWK